MISQIRQILEEDEEESNDTKRVEPLAAPYNVADDSKKTQPQKNPVSSKKKAQRKPTKNRNANKQPKTPEDGSNDELQVESPQKYEEKLEPKEPLLEETQTEANEEDLDMTTVEPNPDDAEKKRPQTKKPQRKPNPNKRKKTAKRPQKPKTPGNPSNPDSIQADHVLNIEEEYYDAEDYSHRSEGGDLGMEGMDHEGNLDKTTVNPTLNHEKKQPQKKKPQRKPNRPPNKQKKPAKRTQKPKIPETVSDPDPNVVQPNEILPENTKGQIEVKIIQEKSDNKELLKETNETVEEEVDMTTVNSSLDDAEKKQSQKKNPVRKPQRNPNRTPNKRNKPAKSPQQPRTPETVPNETENQDVVDPSKTTEEDFAKADSSCVCVNPVLENIQILTKDQSIKIRNVLKSLEKSSEEIHNHPSSTEEVKPIEKAIVEKEIGTETTEIKDGSKKIDEKVQEGLTVIALLRGISGNEVEKLKGLQNAIRNSLESTVPKLRCIESFNARSAKNEDWNELTESINFVSKQFTNKSVSQVLEPISLQNLLDGYEKFLKDEEGIRNSYQDKVKARQC